MRWRIIRTRQLFVSRAWIAACNAASQNRDLCVPRAVWVPFLQRIISRRSCCGFRPGHVHPQSRDADRARVVRQLCPSKTEGAGKTGCPSHPQPRMQNEKAYELITTGSPDRSGLPCAMVLTACFALSLATGLFCHHRRRKFFRQLDASVGASGPHDFTVRVGTFRQAHHPRPPRPAPRFVTIASSPLRDETGIL